MIAPADLKPIRDLPGYYASADERSIYSDRTGKLMKLYASDGPARIQQVNVYRDGRATTARVAILLRKLRGHRRHHLCGRGWGERLLGPCKTPQWVRSKGCLVLPHPSQVSVKPVHTPDDGYFASLAALQTECCPN